MPLFFRQHVIQTFLNWVLPLDGVIEGSRFENKLVLPLVEAT